MKMNPLAKIKNIFNKTPGYAAIRDVSKGREPVSAETKGEDHLHSASQQVRLIAQEREQMRNTAFGPSTARQLQVNCIGTVGGRLTLTTADEDFNRSAGAAFRRWARHAEFQKGLSLNEILSLVLVEWTHHGGDFIVVHDAGILTGGRGSGKIRIFESDEIANVTDADFAKVWGKGYHQTRGIVTDQFGRVCGAMVSNALRGKDVFDDLKKVIVLRLDTPGEWENSDWVFCSQNWRSGQIRGTCTIAHICNELADLQDLRNSEVAAAKLNSSLGIIVSDRDTATENADLERGLPPVYEGCGCEGGEGGNGGNAPDPDAPQEPPPPAATITGLRESMAAIIDCAPNKKIESFRTDRPSLNAEQFLKDELAQCSCVFGFGSTFLTLEPQSSYTAFRGSLLLASASFRVYQKQLERQMLDWLAGRVLRWLGYTLPEDIDEHYYWKWPTMQEVDATKAESAREKRYSNLGATLMSENGWNWRDSIEQTRKEIAICKYGDAWEDHITEVQVVHPSERTVSGQIAEQPEPLEEGEATPNKELVEPTEGEAQ